MPSINNKLIEESFCYFFRNSNFRNSLVVARILSYFVRSFPTQSHLYETSRFPFPPFSSSSRSTHEPSNSLIYHKKETWYSRLGCKSFFSCCRFLWMSIHLILKLNSLSSFVMCCLIAWNKKPSDVSSPNHFLILTCLELLMTENAEKNVADSLWFLFLTKSLTFSICPLTF